MSSKSKKNLICFDAAYSLAAYEAGALQVFNKDNALKMEQNCYDECF